MVEAIVLHLVADWLLQNDWMSRNKSSLLHLASWVHGLVHFIVMLLVFPYWIAGIVAISHVLIDTRVPLTWWGYLIRQTKNDTVSLWRDQVVHVVVIVMVKYLEMMGNG